MFFFKGPTFFGSLKVLVGGVHKFEMETGDILVLPARWPHVVVTIGESIAFAAIFLAVAHFPLILDSHLNTTLEEINEEEVFPSVISIFAVLQFRIRSLQGRINSLRKSQGRSSIPLFSNEQLSLLRDQVIIEVEAIKLVRTQC